MQVGSKWCSGFNRDKLKLKIYMAYNLWEETTFLPYNIFCDFS